MCVVIKRQVRAVVEYIWKLFWTYEEVEMFFKHSPNLNVGIGSFDLIRRENRSLIWIILRAKYLVSSIE